jgi:hypothetical protein
MKKITLKNLIVAVLMSSTGLLQAAAPPPPIPPPPPGLPVDSSITILIVFSIAFAFYKYNAIHTKKA